MIALELLKELTKSLCVVWHWRIWDQYNSYLKDMKDNWYGDAMLNIVSNPEKTIFLPLQLILDNIIFIQEIFHWAKASKQPTIFRKLDFF